jgi:regulatory protein
MKNIFHKEAIKKIEHYCAYQRCHEEVKSKLRTMKMDSESDQLLRISFRKIPKRRTFCLQFRQRKKHRIKQWGIRITNELKFGRSTSG